ncbi:MAG: hypothetical protein ACRCUM_02515 [Mycoplasmoidaceae bacterium]
MLEISVTVKGEKIFDSSEIFKRKNKKFRCYSILALSFLNFDSLEKECFALKDTYKLFFGSSLLPIIIIILSFFAFIINQMNTDERREKKLKERENNPIKAKITDLIYLLIAVGALIAIAIV